MAHAYSCDLTDSEFRGGLNQIARCQPSPRRTFEKSMIAVVGDILPSSRARTTPKTVVRFVQSHLGTTLGACNSGRQTSQTPADDRYRRSSSHHRFLPVALHQPTVSVQPAVTR